MGVFSDCLLSPPSVQLLCSTIPIRDEAVQITKHDRVMSLIEEAHLPRKFLVEGLNLCFLAFPHSDVVTCFKDCNRPILLVTSQRPPALNYHLEAVGLCLLEFALPTVAFQKRSEDLFQRIRENGFQEFIGFSTDRVLSRPSVEVFGPLVPVRNDETHVAGEDRVVRQVQQTGSLLNFNLKVVATPKNILLQAPPNCAEMPDECSQ